MSPSEQVNKHAAAEKRPTRRREEETAAEGTGREGKTKEWSGEGEWSVSEEALSLGVPCELEVSSAIMTQPRVLGSPAAAEGVNKAWRFCGFRGAPWASVDCPSGPGRWKAAERTVPRRCGLGDRRWLMVKQRQAISRGL